MTQHEDKGSTSAVTGDATGGQQVPDPFNPQTLRLSADFVAAAGVKKVLNVVPVPKPDRQDFIRTHPNPDYRLLTAIIEMREEREIFLISPAMIAELAAEFIPVMLFAAITRQGVLFLWPCKMPGPEGRTNRWHESALDAAERAEERWVRVIADMNLGAYQIYEPQGALPHPEWPDLPFGEILKVAFRGRLIDSFDHPVVRRLRGLD